MITTSTSLMEWKPHSCMCRNNHYLSFNISSFPLSLTKKCVSILKIFHVEYVQGNDPP